MPPARFQRATFRLGGGRSMQLSYGSTGEESYHVYPVKPYAGLRLVLDQRPYVVTGQLLTAGEEFEFDDEDQSYDHASELFN